MQYDSISITCGSSNTLLLSSETFFIPNLLPFEPRMLDDLADKHRLCKKEIKMAGKLELLSPDNCALVLIDHQPQMFFGVQSIDRQTLLNNVIGLSKAAKAFNLPTILTTVSAKTFSGDLVEEIRAVFPKIEPIDRTTMNAWEDPKVRKAIEGTQRKKLVMAALWTEVCLAFPVLSALEAGYEVYAVADASGATTVSVHEMAMQRLIQAGTVPITWLQFLLELQRDWSRQETYGAVTEIIKRHAGAYGLGIQYVETFCNKHSK